MALQFHHERENSGLYTCRICYASEFTIKNFISPCKCSGTIQYVHEECLKEWLISTNPDLRNRECELCKFPYKSRIVWKAYFNCEDLLKINFTNCISIVIVIGLMILIVFLIFYLGKKCDRSSAQDKTYMISLIIGSFIAFVIFCYILLYLIKGIVVNPKKKHWKIKNLIKNQRNKVMPIENQNFIRTGHEDEPLKEIDVQSDEIRRIFKSDNLPRYDESANIAFQCIHISNNSEQDDNSKSLEI